MKQKNMFLILGVLALAAFIAAGCQTGQVVTPPTQNGQQTTEEPVSISLISAPSNARVGDKISFTWKVNGPQKTIQHTAIHYDYTPHLGDYGTDVGPAASGYPQLTTKYASGQFNIPDTFTDDITLDKAGILYYRAHAIVDGKNYWTVERSVVVTRQETVTTPPKPDVNYVIRADDDDFYMDGRSISSITVEKGTMVEIMFNVDDDNVYYGGLDFRGCGTNGGAKPGGSVRYDFTASNSCTITSYWPSSGVVKDTLDIRVPGDFSGMRTGSGGGGY